jgi:hypothetical protein
MRLALTILIAAEVSAFIALPAAMVGTATLPAINENVVSLLSLQNGQRLP